MGAMSSSSLKPQEPETSALGTLAWTLVLLLLAVGAVAFLSWLGPYGEQ